MFWRTISVWLRSSPSAPCVWLPTYILLLCNTTKPIHTIFVIEITMGSKLFKLTMIFHLIIQFVAQFCCHIAGLEILGYKYVYAVVLLSTFITFIVIRLSTINILGRSKLSYVSVFEIDAVICSMFFPHTWIPILRTDAYQYQFAGHVSLFHSRDKFMYNAIF